MFEKFTTENAETFRQRYEGTFGFYTDRDTRKRILTKLTYIRNDYCGFVDSRGVEYKLYPNSENDIGFEFIPPRSNYYNTSDGAVLVRRIPARQFQRGLSAKNTSLYTLTPKNGLKQGRVDFTLLEKIYLNPVPLKDAYANWDQAQSVAISKHLACAGSDLYLFENKIGTFTKKANHFVFKLAEPELWRTEIQDALRNVAATMEIS